MQRSPTPTNQLTHHRFDCCGRTSSSPSPPLRRHLSAATSPLPSASAASQLPFRRHPHLPPSPPPPLRRAVSAVAVCAAAISAATIYGATVSAATAIAAAAFITTVAAAFSPWPVARQTEGRLASPPLPPPPQVSRVAVDVIYSFGISGIAGERVPPPHCT